jgi:hypothetical protein
MVLTDELLATCRKLYGDVTCDEDLHEMRGWVAHLFDTIDALKAECTECADDVEMLCDERRVACERIAELDAAVTALCEERDWYHEQLNAAREKA